MMLLGDLSGDTAARLDREAAERSHSIDVPAGARALGCCNCRNGDRARHPELGVVYCWGCPVNVRRRARGQRPII